VEAFEIGILASFLAASQRRLPQGESVSFAALLAARGGRRLTQNWNCLLGRGELVVWVDDHAVTRVDTDVLVARDSALSIMPGMGAFGHLVTAADAHGCRWN
jgi:hypothetical protein